MALSDKKLEYTKRWTNPADFPTYESREEKVRSDMQLLFDEAAFALNALIDYLSASVIPFTPTAAIDETNIQAAIVNVQEQISQAIAGTVPDRSLAGVKLALGAVGEDEIADDAVTQDKLADDSVGEDQLINSSVTNDKLALESVGPENLKPNILPGKADLDSGILNRAQRRLRFNSPGITNGYTLSLSDAESILYLSNASVGAVNIPANTTAAFNVGAVVVLVCAGEQVTITPAQGVTLLALGSAVSGSVVVGKKNSTVLLYKVGENGWVAAVIGLQSESVGSDDLGLKAVKQANIDDSAVGTNQIAANAVTLDKTTGVQKSINVADVTLTTGGWSNKSQAVSISGMTANSEFVAAPNTAAGWAAAADAMVYPPTAGAGTLTFTCDSVPAADIPITVYWW